MNRTISFALLGMLGITLLALVACAPQAAAPSTIPPQNPPVLTNDNVPKTVYDELPSDVRDILNKGLSQRTPGFSYTYNHFRKNYPVNESVNLGKVVSKDTRRKITLSIAPQLAKNFALSEIITNSETKTAVGVCTSSIVCGKDVPVTRSMVYSDFNLVGPEEWGTALTGTNKVGEEQIDGRSMFKLTGTIDGKATTVWLDRYSGLALKATQGDDVWEYTNLVLGVTDADLNP